jgi:uncharacterized membrane-anchored protein
MIEAASIAMTGKTGGNHVRNDLAELTSLNRDYVNSVQKKFN